MPILKNEPFKILFDWGGVIAKDADFFREISVASKRKPEKSEFKRPEDWLSIRSAGNENYFDTIQSRFFDKCKVYGGIDEVFRNLAKKDNARCHVVFDNRPKLEMSDDNVTILLGKSLQKNGIDYDAIHVEADKPGLAKTMDFDLVVDDDPRMILSYAMRGIDSIFVLRKWNRKFDLDTLSLYMGEKANDVWQLTNIVEDMDDLNHCIEKILKEKKGE